MLYQGTESTQWWQLYGSALPVAVPLKLYGCASKDRWYSHKANFARHQSSHVEQNATWSKSGKSNKPQQALGYCSICTSPPDALPLSPSIMNRHLDPFGKVFQSEGQRLGWICAVLDVSKL